MIIPVTVQQQLGGSLSKDQLLADISQIEDENIKDILGNIVLAMTHRHDPIPLGDGTGSYREVGNPHMNQSGVSIHVVNKNAADTGFSPTVGDAPFLIFKTRFSEQVETTATPTSEPDLREYIQYGKLPLSKGRYHRDMAGDLWGDMYSQNVALDGLGNEIVDSSGGVIT